MVAPVIWQRRHRGEDRSNACGCADALIVVLPPAIPEPFQLSTHPCGTPGLPGPIEPLDDQDFFGAKAFDMVAVDLSKPASVVLSLRDVPGPLGQRMGRAQQDNAERKSA